MTMTPAKMAEPIEMLLRGEPCIFWWCTLAPPGECDWMIHALCSIKSKTPYSWWYLCQLLTDFHNPFTGWFLSKFCSKTVMKSSTTPSICYHTTLWKINVRKQVINDKLQGSVATYLRCGGVVNNQIKKGLLLSLPVIFFKLLNIWQCYKQKGGCLVHVLCLPTALLKVKENARHNPLFCPELCQIYTGLNIFYWRTQQ